LFEYTTGSNANDDAPFDNKNSNTIMVDRVHKKWTGITTSNSSRTLWFDGPILFEGIRGHCSSTHINKTHLILPIMASQILSGMLGIDPNLSRM